MCVASDVSGAAYTYLVNGHGPQDNWTGLFQIGERVRLRIINASAMTNFNVRIPGLPMTVVQADGDQYDRYEGGVAMAERLGHHLVVVEDSGDHEVYAFAGNTALDDIVNAYLVDGVLPDKRVGVPGSTPRPDIPPDA